MSQFIHQPHDKLFKLSMGEIAVAKEFFTAYLPDHIINKINLDTLHLQKQTFIDDTYKTTEADVIYCTSLKENNLPIYFYLLCEHQSEVDHFIAFRLLVYLVRIMESHHKKFPDAILPLVYPMVVYSGEKKWDAPRDIFSLFKDEEETAREWLFKPYHLLDIHRMQDEELRQHQLFGLVAFALKHRQAVDNLNFWKTLFTWVNQIDLQGSNTALGRTVLYYATNGNIKADSVDLILQQAEQCLSAELRGEVMTLAEHLEQRAEQRFLKKGETAVLLRQLKHRFGLIPSDYMQRIEQADNQALLNWSENILDAKTLEEVFAA